jgi:hypothetical protein
MFEAERVIDRWEQIYGDLLKGAQAAEGGEGVVGEWPRPRRIAADVVTAGN